MSWFFGAEIASDVYAGAAAFAAPAGADCCCGVRGTSITFGGGKSIGLAPGEGWSEKTGPALSFDS